MDISLDGRWVVTASGRTLRLWDLDDETPLERARSLVGRELTPAEHEQYSLYPGDAINGDAEGAAAKERLLDEDAKALIRN